MAENQNYINWAALNGPNLGYFLELYDRYQQEPASIDPPLREMFNVCPPPLSLENQATQLTTEFTQTLATDQIVAAVNLAQAIRSFGHLATHLDPLGSQPPGDPSLEFVTYSISPADLRKLPASLINLSVPLSPTNHDHPITNAYDAVEALRVIYCNTLGYDYGHILLPEERTWLREAAECRSYFPTLNQAQNEALFERLTQVEAFEQFLQRTFPGRTRFSVEGADMLIPILDEILEAAVQDEICTVIIGMAHRGRLNVLTHILQMPYAEILAEFKDPGVKPSAWEELGWTGDVKYHKGASRRLTGDETVHLVIGMPSNPSHLEHINPVIEGMVRSAGSKVDQAGLPQFFPKASLPILIHGDASFAGQGIVAETLNLSHLEGYDTGGTIHIIVNNQLGYTASAEETRSSPYASDFARGLKIPIIHVNADDPLACLEAARTACAYRANFNKDFVIDLVGYRRYGHNEGDEPAFTQPVMARKIRDHPTVRSLWADHLVEQGVLSPDAPDHLMKQGMDQLQDLFNHLNPAEAMDLPDLTPPPHGAARKVKTAVPLERLIKINSELLAAPPGFKVNHRLSRDREHHQHAFDISTGTTIDWSLAEALAFATILADGVPIRLTGQDTIRGTFSQRHAVYYDEETGDGYNPFHHLSGVKVSFEIRNSPVTENAALGFEFGYNIQSPERLVLWEAQYGDFINAGQAMVDEFILTARAKWSQTPSLVILLPHGNEGQGPDHSSGRPERFLQNAAEINLRMAIPTTAAQYFHLLRRQALLLNKDPLPLIVFTPKGLLRHPLTASRPLDLAKGSWIPVLPFSKPVQPKKVRRLILCSGRIYTDLANHPIFKQANDLATLRLEQIYPLPTRELAAYIDSFPALTEISWVQEEPNNMGVWSFVRPALQKLASHPIRLTYFGRPASSSPAEGSSAWYSIVQKAIVTAALTFPNDLPPEALHGILIERE
jgi:2-oxoglutarate dehydrogenase E1 component